MHASYYLLKIILIISYFRKTLQGCQNVGFVNIGRGNIIEEDDIVYALDNNLFSGAVLDVFNVEPLPKLSPLWSHPKVSSMYFSMHM